MAGWSVFFKCKVDGEEKEVQCDVESFFAHNAPKVAIKSLEGTDLEQTVKYRVTSLCVKPRQ